MAVQARHGPQLVEARKLNVGFKINRQVGKGGEAVFFQSKLLPNNRMQATPKAGLLLRWFRFRVGFWSGWLRCSSRLAFQEMYWFAPNLSLHLR